ncbi:hypothetical protein [Streptosporangium amethystogenes]|uniref:hypothetical protein n=1 Tax=Streptosporangium amethystogenes TaxID=2002 RepID=UPI0004C64B80|nr:hypothetical protein [Streptosporangium amethystogenes]
MSPVRKDGTVGIWDTATGRPRPVTIRIPEPYAALDPTGTRLLSLAARTACRTAAVDDRRLTGLHRS